MEIQFLGAAKTVTGSKYLLKLDSKQLLIDCGLFQGLKTLRLRNWEQPAFDPTTLDAVILTHAHIDHSGYIPLLVKLGYTGPIYATRGTTDLCSILLPDSGRIHEEDAYFANKHHFSKHEKALPLYTEEDARNALPQFVVLNYHQEQQLFDKASFQFLPVGHILGASMVKLNLQKKTILFTGDMGRLQDPIMRSPEIVTETDYLVMESTYGDKLHDTTSPTEQLGTIIKSTYARKGIVIIPSFAVGRTQSIIYYINELKKNHVIPDIPVFLDSPMATDVTELMSSYVGEHRLSKDQCRDFSKSVFYIRTREESKLIDTRKVPCIIISASGMAEGGRILHHLKALAGDPKNTIVFVGYQAEGTRGDRIIKGAKQIKIHGAMVEIRAHVESLLSMSAHADYQDLLAWLSHFKNAPLNTFIIHGEEHAAFSLKAKIEKTLNWKCSVPEYLEKVVI